MFPCSTSNAERSHQRGSSWVRHGVQVIDTSHELDVKNNDDLVLTSRVTTRLRHPCIVRTMAHCVTEAPSSKPWDSAHSAPSKSSSKRDACWMMLEYCDKGTLQVRPCHTLIPARLGFARNLASDGALEAKGCSMGMQEAIMRGSFVEGKDPGAAPDIKAVVSAALEIAMGMAYLHGRDLIHGDLTGGQHLRHDQLLPSYPLSMLMAPWLIKTLPYQPFEPCGKVLEATW